jgi:hypothetical protein
MLVYSLQQISNELEDKILQNLINTKFEMIIFSFQVFLIYNQLKKLEKLQAKRVIETSYRLQPLHRLS